MDTPVVVALAVDLILFLYLLGDSMAARVPMFPRETYAWFDPFLWAGTAAILAGVAGVLTHGTLSVIVFLLAIVFYTGWKSQESESNKGAGIGATADDGFIV